MPEELKVAPATSQISVASPAAARVSVLRVVQCILLTWIAPGAGHWMLGRRGKALLFFCLITFLYFFGMWLGSFRNVNLDRFPLHFIGQVFYGGATLPALWLTRGLTLEVAQDLPAGLEAVQWVSMEFDLLDVGVLYSTIAGLLNLCVMVDVFETAYPASREGAQT